MLFLPDVCLEAVGIEVLRRMRAPLHTLHRQWQGVGEGLLGIPGNLIIGRASLGSATQARTELQVRDGGDD